MKNRFDEVLAKLNLSQTASRVYIALLETGKATADTVAKKAKTYKPNAYDALAKLEHAGLVASMTEGKKRFFLPTNPEKIEAVLDEKEHQELLNFELARKSFHESLPALLASYNSTKEKDVFEVYRGKQAYKTLINEILKEKRDNDSGQRQPFGWKGFGNLQVYDLFDLEFHRWFKDIPMKLFSARTEDVIRRYEEARHIAKLEIKWLPKDMYMPIVWVVFGSNVLIAIYEPEIIVMRIKSRQTVQTFSNQFDYLWFKATRP